MNPPPDAAPGDILAGGLARRVGAFARQVAGPACRAVVTSERGSVLEMGLVEGCPAWPPLTRLLRTFLSVSQSVPEAAWHWLVWRAEDNKIECCCGELGGGASRARGGPEDEAVPFVPAQPPPPRLMAAETWAAFNLRSSDAEAVANLAWRMRFLAGADSPVELDLSVRRDPVDDGLRLRMDGYRELNLFYLLGFLARARTYCAGTKAGLELFLGRDGAVVLTYHPA
jgi:hypothetical protein